MSIFLFIRHGKKIETIGDPSLSDLGNQQAQATAECLKTDNIAAIYASPLSRTIQTAQAINNFHNINLVIDNRLRERANWGDLRNQSFEEFIEIWDKCNADRDYIPPVGDSARKSGDRLESFIREKHKEHIDKK